MGNMRLDRRTGLALIAASIAGALLLAALPLPAAATAASLHLTSGSVSVSRAGVAARPAVDGEALAAGDRVTTGADGSVILAFVDGSTLTVEPGTDIVINELTAHPGSTVTRLVQAAGRTWSSVQALAPGRSRYEVSTPALTASVRGTAFVVEVAADGATRVRTVEGEVSVVNALGEVVVTAGTETSATTSSAPVPPTAPPASPQRSIQMGGAPFVVVDDARRGCGRVDGTVLRQIPGCVVTDDEIRIDGPSAQSTLTVIRDASPDAVVVVTPRPASDPPVTEVTLPLIGTVPVQGPRGTSVPIAPIPTLSPPPLPGAGVP